MRRNQVREEKQGIFGVSPLPPLKLSIGTYSKSLYEVFSREYRVTAMSFTRFDTVKRLPRADIIHSSRFVEHRAMDLYQPFSWRYAYSFFEKYQPKIVHHNVFIPSAQVPFFPLMRKARKHGSANAVSYHNLLPHEPLPFDKHLMWKFLLETDYFLVHTGFQKKQLVKLGFAEERIVMTPFFHIYDTIYELRGKSLRVKKDSGKKVISFFGLLREYKGLDLLLDAMPSLDDVTLLIMGKPVGYYGAQIKKKVKKLQEEGIDVRAVFEFIPDEDLVTGILSSDIVVLPYRRFSSMSGIGKLCEVLKVPTVSTRVPGLMDLQSNIATSAPETGSLSKALQASLKKVNGTPVNAMERIQEAMKNIEDLKKQFLDEFTRVIEM